MNAQKFSRYWVLNGVVLLSARREKHLMLFKPLVCFLWVQCAFVKLLVFHLHFVYIKYAI